jgi:hypothetical protein
MCRLRVAGNVIRSLAALIFRDVHPDIAFAFPVEMQPNVHWARLPMRGFGGSYGGQSSTV